MSPNVKVDIDQIKVFCKKWKIIELSLFGSVLRDDFRPDSDIDVMIDFLDDAKWSLFDLVDMQDELKSLFGREIDLVEKGTIRNPFRNKKIMAEKEILYAA